MHDMVLSPTRAVVPVEYDGALSADYKALLAKYPVLDAQEEIRLAQRLHEQNDLQAAQTLVFSNLRGVLYVAYGYRGYGLALMDLVQEGTIGLMKAVKRFYPGKGVRLFSYALPWIKAEVQQFIVRNWKMVRAVTTDASKKLFFNLRRMKREQLVSLEAMGEEKMLEGIAHSLGVPMDEVRRMDTYMRAEDMAIAPDNVAQLEWEDPQGTPETQLMEKQAVEQQQLVLSAMDTLNARERDIVQARYLAEPPKTLKELAKTYGVSLERIRQLEQQALLRLRGHCAV